MEALSIKTEEIHIQYIWLTELPLLVLHGNSKWVDSVYYHYKRDIHTVHHTELCTIINHRLKNAVTCPNITSNVAWAYNNCPIVYTARLQDY